MAVKFKEEERNGNTVFVIDAADAIEAFNLLYSRRVGASIEYEDNDVLMRSIGDGTIEMRNALKGI